MVYVVNAVVHVVNAVVNVVIIHMEGNIVLFIQILENK